MPSTTWPWISAFSSETSEAMPRSSPRIRRARSTTISPDSVRRPFERFTNSVPEFGLQMGDAIRDVRLDGAEDLGGA